MTELDAGHRVVLADEAGEALEVRYEVVMPQAEVCSPDAILRGGNREVKRLSHEQALRASTTRQRSPFLSAAAIADSRARVYTCAPSGAFRRIHLDGFGW